MDELNCENFVVKIKGMNKRERSKIQLDKLLEIICQLPDRADAESPPTPAVSTQLDELRGAITKINEMTTNNTTEIANLRIQNADLVQRNIALQLEVNLLKEHAKECHRNQPDAPPHLAPPPPLPAQTRCNSHDEIEQIRNEIVEMKQEINSIQQYLRVNNLEVVGLPEPNNGESEETLLVNAFNQLAGIETPVRHEDIDISHPLPSNRKDNKQVHVVRFISRKTKFMILNAKKQEENKQYKFRGNDVYINEHLSKNNRSLFAETQAKKKLLKYKYCWTRAGSIFYEKLMIQM